MNRIISLCCVCLILVMSLAVPARAADSILDDSFIELLDFGNANNSDSNIISFVGRGSASYFFNFTDYYLLGYVDVLFYSNRNITEVLGNGDVSLTVERISDYYYRAYGYLPRYEDSRVFLTFVSSDNSATTFVTIYSVKMNTIRDSRFDIDAYCRIVAADYDQTIHFVPSDEVNHRIFDATDDFLDTYLFLYIHTDEWKKYDYIDFQFMFDISSITSVTACMGNINIPVSYSFFDSSNIEGDAFFVSLRLDLTGLDRTIDDFPMITIMGRLDSGVLNSIDFVNCSGFIVGSDINPIYSYFRDLYDSLDSWLSSQTSSLQVEMQDMIMSISMEFTNLKSTINSLSSSLNSWINNQTSALQNSIVVWFSNLNGWLDSQTSALQNSIVVWFSNLKGWLESQTSALQNSIVVWFSNLKGWLDSQTDRLESAIRGDTDPGDDFQDQVDQKDQQMDDMAAVMDSVTKPAIQDINVSVDQYIDPADVQVLATPLTVFLEVDLFRTMIIMSILMATVSFTLYGKR